MKVEIGQWWRTTPSFPAWKIERIFSEGHKEHVELSQNGNIKKIQVQYLLTGYMLVGGEKEARCISDWKRHKYSLASDIANG